MIRPVASVQVFFCFPQSDEGKKALAQRMAKVYAEAVIHAIKNLPCSANEKQKLLDAVVRSAQQKTG